MLIQDSIQFGWWRIHSDDVGCFYCLLFSCLSDGCEQLCEHTAMRTLIFTQRVEWINQSQNHGNNFNLFLSIYLQCVWWHFGLTLGSLGAFWSMTKISHASRFHWLIRKQCIISLWALNVALSYYYNYTHRACFGRRTVVGHHGRW